jgi:hypothetical protein
MKILTKTGTYTEINDKLYNLVKDNPKARERKFKMRSVAAVLQEKYPELQKIQLDNLEKYLKKASSFSRQWRKLLEEKPEFQGNDYIRTKKQSVDKVKKDLGYRVK